MFSAFPLFFDKFNETMKETKSAELISKDELLYWIDKDFVQETARTKIGRTLNEEEMLQLKKLIEFGLWDAVYDTIKIAIDEVTEYKMGKLTTE